MLLINALICNADTLDFKIHLRSDFARCGVIQAIDVIFFIITDNFSYLEYINTHNFMYCIES